MTTEIPGCKGFLPAGLPNGNVGDDEMASEQSPGNQARRDLTIGGQTADIGAMPIVVICLLVLLVAPTHAQTTRGIPAPVGDQLVFFYDARTDRVPFLTIANPGPEEITAEISFYPRDLSARLGRSVLTLPARGNVVVNPAEEAGGVAGGQAGLAVVTPIRGDGDPTAVVPPEPLMGGYTIANTALGAGFGDNPMGRLAVTGSGQRATPGTSVDGGSVRYQRFTPEVLLIPTYYNPADLDPPERDGNRVILAAFRDRYDSGFELLPHSVTTRATIMDRDGFVVSSRSLTVDAVLLSDLQSVAGGRTLGSSGKVFFEADTGDGNLFGIFSQSLAAFGAGARMPAVARAPDPGPTPGPTPVPTLGPQPTATPDPGGICGNGIVEGFEECDGDDLDDAICQDVVGDGFRCTGRPGCNDQCEYTGGTCNCACESDFDCLFEVDCEEAVPGCGEVFGVCEDNTCVTTPVGSPEICNGFDPDPDFIDDPEPRCF